MSGGNDLFAGTGRNYTNGLKLTYSRPCPSGSLTEARGWADDAKDDLPPVGDRTAQRAVAFIFGQSIYPPGDTQGSDLMEGDRPHAGHTCFGVGFRVRKDNRRNIREVD